MIDLPDHIADLRRLKSLFALIFLMLLVIVTRLWYLQVVMGAELAQESAAQQLRRVRRVAARGLIVDRNNRILATNRPKFVVSLSPDSARKNPLVLPQLADLLHQPLSGLLDKLNEAGGGPARYDAVPLARGVDIEILSRIEEHRMDLPGVLVTRDPVRWYNDEGLCTHVLGVTRPISREKLMMMSKAGYHGGDNIGVFGLEDYYERELRGADGGTDTMVDARGRMQRSLMEHPSTPGKTLELSLDLNLQRVAVKALQEQFGNKQRAGAIVAEDPDTGEIIALASSPTFDLNSYGEKVAELTHNSHKPFLNRASGSAYPCGSPFKLVTAAAGLETSVISTGSRDYCPGYARLGNRRFHCDEVHGSVDFYRAIGESCNVFFFHAAQSVGVERLGYWARNFGLGERTGIDLPADRKGLVPSPEWKMKRKRAGSWMKGDTLNMAIGQGGVQVSPLQLVNFTSALANGGTLWRPHLVSAIKDPVTGRVQRIEPEAKGQLGLSRRHLEAIRKGMRQALLPHGTAFGSAIPGLAVAGKTGTVQIKKGVNNAVFVCFAPYSHPRIAVAVLIEGGGYGAQTAAPIARRLLVQYFRVTNAGVGSSYGGRD